MVIKSLEKMEAIVKKNNSLSWDGWTVVSLSKNPTGWMSPRGAFIKGSWYIQNRYEPNSNGWEIPDKIVR